MDLVILVNAKKIGLSFAELNELRVKDFFTMVDIYCDEPKKETSTTTREATQKDIDNFYA